MVTSNEAAARGGASATQSSASSTPEQAVWEGTPSQILNLPQYFLWTAVWVVLLVIAFITAKSMETVPSYAVVLLVIAALVPPIVVAWKWLVLANTKYTLTTQRLRTRTGVLNKHLDELELYRVRDYKLEQPFFLRIFSLATLSLTTSDRTHPIVVLRAIPRGEELREQMRTYVEESRLRRGVREIDLE